MILSTGGEGACCHGVCLLLGGLCYWGGCLVLGGTWSGGCAWSRGVPGPGGERVPGGDPSPGTATAADGTHPTGMHTCFFSASSRVPKDTDFNSDYLDLL